MVPVLFPFPAVPIREMSRAESGESSAAIRERVIRARQIQTARLKDMAGLYGNAHMGSREIKRFCPLGDVEQDTLESAVESLGLSARAYDRILQVSRTIAVRGGGPMSLDARMKRQF